MRDLEPGVVKIESPQAGPDAEVALFKEAINCMKAGLAVSLLADNFDADHVPQVLYDSLVPNTDKLAPEVLLKERLYKFMGGVLHEAMGIEMPPGDDLSRPDPDSLVDIVAPDLPEAFTEDLLSQVANLELDFDKLAGMRSAFAETRLLELMRDVYALGFSTDHPVENAADKAYQMVRNILYDPEYTLPTGREDALYLLCFLPWSARRLTKEAIVANQIIHTMDEVLGAELDQAEEEMFAAFKTVLGLDSLFGQTWYELADEHGMSEETAKEMALLSADHIAALSTMERLCDEGGAQRVIDAYNASVKFLNETITEAYHRADFSILANTDIGHGFSGFRDHGIDNALAQGVSQGERYKSLANTEKDGQRAVILEDDPEQSVRWQAFINDQTSYTTGDADVFPTLEGIDDAIEDLSVTLFVLDIQNGEDDTAGIRLGEQVLRRRLELHDDPNHIGTKIIVWSASSEHVKLANRHFRKFIKDRPYQLGQPSIDTSFLGTSHYGGAKIAIDVRHKLWNDYKDV